MRAVAAQVVADVAAHGVSLNEALPRRLEAVDAPDRALLQALCYGTLRWYIRLDRVLAVMLERPLKRRDAELRALILVGLYQLSDMSVPSHAAVGQTVEAATVLRKPAAKGLVNAVLRRFQREHETLSAEAEQTDEARYAHPQWLIEKIQSDWPEHWADILEANNRQAPMWLRVNARACSAAEYRDELGRHGVDAKLCAAAPQALCLNRPVEVSTLPGFAEGRVSVQDAAAQLAVRWLGARPGERVLDACAAPGNKTCHILETCPEAREVVAVDVSSQRLGRLHENVRRLRLSPTVHEADVCRLDEWWDGQPFDRVLLDVPCSATGVVRRHPDIKLLRRKEDIAQFGARQAKFLDKVWSILIPGGHLLYVTCSILKCENDRQVQQFMGRHSGVERAALDHTLVGGRGIVATEWGLQILPGAHDMDGFFFAALRKPR